MVYGKRGKEIQIFQRGYMKTLFKEFVVLIYDIFYVCYLSFFSVFYI